MVENWSVIHFILQTSQSFIRLSVNLPQQVKPLTWSHNKQLAVGAHMAGPSVLCSLLEHLMRRCLMAIIKPSQLRCHPKEIDEERMLIDVVINTELSFGQRELESVLEVIVRGQNLLCFLLFVDDRNSL